MMKQAWLAMASLIFSSWAGALAQEGAPAAKPTVKPTLVEPEKNAASGAATVTVTVASGTAAK